MYLFSRYRVNRVRLVAHKSFYTNLLEFKKAFENHDFSCTKYWSLIINASAIYPFLKKLLNIGILLQSTPVDETNIGIFLHSTSVKKC